MSDRDERWLQFFIICSLAAKDLWAGVLFSVMAGICYFVARRHYKEISKP